MPALSTLQNCAPLCITVIALVAECGVCYTQHRKHTLSFPTLLDQFNRAAGIRHHTTVSDAWASKNLRGGGVTGADRMGERLMEQPKSRQTSTVEIERKIEHQRSGIELFPESESMQKGLDGSYRMFMCRRPCSPLKIARFQEPQRPSPQPIFGRRAA